MNKINIALISGGDSGELEISLKSASVIAKNIDAQKYNVYHIFISGPQWICKTKNNQEVAVDKNDFSVTLNDEKIVFQLAFIAIHGTPGEDGKLQGYFDMMRIPYTTCDFFTSAVTFNKYFTYQVASNLGVKMAQQVYLNHKIKLSDDEIITQVGLPCFVKPNKGGSSVGVSKVNSVHELAPAIQKAFHEDGEVLVEEFISGNELTCGMLHYQGENVIFPLTEIVANKEFFDYEAKYSGLADEITPARVSDEMAAQCRNISNHLYNTLHCRGIVRFDYIMHENELYFLEVNTIPGLSEASIVPQQAQAYGITIAELFDMAIQEALR